MQYEIEMNVTAVVGSDEKTKLPETIKNKDNIPKKFKFCFSAMYNIKLNGFAIKRKKSAGSNNFA